MPRVVVLGSINTDMTVRLPRLPTRGETRLGGPFHMGPGGKGANQAVAARRAGAEVVLLAAVGDDDFGLRALERYRDEGIDISAIRTVDDESTGVALIFVDKAGENLIGVAPGANARLTPEDIDRLPDPVFNQGGVFLASLEVPLATVARALRRAARAGMITVLNPAPVDHGLIQEGADILSRVDVLTPNHDEAIGLVGLMLDNPAEAAEAAWTLRESFRVRNVVVTRGAEGSIVRTDDGAFHVPASPVEAVDTVGAGDTFNGALAVALAEGKPLLDATVWASAAAALAVTQSGAQAGIPFRDEIDAQAASDPTPARPFEDYYDDWIQKETHP